jgi:non-homologous end joining protein Ku
MKDKVSSGPVVCKITVPDCLLDAIPLVWCCATLEVPGTLRAVDADETGYIVDLNGDTEMKIIVGEDEETMTIKEFCDLARLTVLRFSDFCMSHDQDMLAKAWQILIS